MLALLNDVGIHGRQAQGQGQYHVSFPIQVPPNVVSKADTGYSRDRLATKLDTVLKVRILFHFNLAERHPRLTCSVTFPIERKGKVVMLSVTPMKTSQ